MFRPRLRKVLLKRVLGMAIDRLPAGVREPARRLAERVLGEVAGEATGAEEEQAAVPEVASVQQEFDLQLASLLTASDEVEPSSATVTPSLRDPQ